MLGIKRSDIARYEDLRVGLPMIGRDKPAKMEASNRPEEVKVVQGFFRVGGFEFARVEHDEARQVQTPRRWLVGRFFRNCAAKRKRKHQVRRDRSADGQCKNSCCIVS